MSMLEKVIYFFRSPLAKLGKPLILGIIAGILFLMLFAKLVEDLLFNELTYFDQAVTDFIRSFATETLTNIAIFITYIGSAYVEIFLMLIVGGYLLFRLKYIWEPVILGSSLIGGWLLNVALKAIFQRSRPDIEHLVEVGGYSFPSGHAMVSMTFYGMLGYLVWLHMRERSKASWYVSVLTVILIMAIGISRVYLGVHFPSDVVAGFAAGGAWLTACIIGLHTIRYYKSQRMD